MTDHDFCRELEKARGLQYIGNLWLGAVSVEQSTTVQQNEDAYKWIIIITEVI